MNALRVGHAHARGLDALDHRVGRDPSDRRRSGRAVAVGASCAMSLLEVVDAVRLGRGLERLELEAEVHVVVRGNGEDRRRCSRRGTR